MPPRKLTTFVAWIAAGLMLLGGYAGIYFAVVQISPGYLIEGRFGHRFFAPVHWLDRHMRPNVWKPPSRRPPAAPLESGLLEEGASGPVKP